VIDHSGQFADPVWTPRGPQASTPPSRKEALISVGPIFLEAGFERLDVATAFNFIQAVNLAPSFVWKKRALPSSSKPSPAGRVCRIPPIRASGQGIILMDITWLGVSLEVSRCLPFTPENKGLKEEWKIGPQITIPVLLEFLN